MGLVLFCQLNFPVSDLVELFCESIVLYKELFCKQNKARDSCEGKGLQLRESFLVDGKSLQLECDHLNRKLSQLEGLVDSTLKADLKREIESLSEKVALLLEEDKVLHGNINQMKRGEKGHIISFSQGVEYFGRIKGKEPSGKGLEWKQGNCTRGYFEDGKVCGFGEKYYRDGSLYR